MFSFGEKKKNYESTNGFVIFVLYSSLNRVYLEKMVRLALLDLLALL